jgi:hypothetical protein
MDITKALNNKSAMKDVAGLLEPLQMFPSQM